MSAPPRRRTSSFAWPALLFGLGLLYFLYHIHDVLIPFLLSFVVAYLANPVIHHFEAKGLRRSHVVAALYLLIATTVTLSASILLPAMTSELALLQGRAPQYFTRSQEIFSALQADMAHRLPFGQSLVEKMNLHMYNPIMEQLPKIPSYILGIFPLLSLLFLVPFISFFILTDADAILQKAIQTCPSRYVEQVLHILSEVDTALGNYLRGIFIVALAIGATSYIGLMIMGVDYALGVATLSGISSFVPYLGAIMGAVVGGLVAFFQFHTAWAPMKVVFLFSGIRLADEALLQPIIARHSVHLHPLIFLGSLMVGGKVFGFIGLVFGVPAACVVKALLGVAWDWYTTESQTAPKLTLKGLEVPYL